MSVRIALLSPAVGSGNIGDSLIELAVRRLLRDDVEYQRVSIRAPLAEATIGAINEARCALLCGTNLYQRDWHSALTPEMLDRIVVRTIPVGVGSSAARLDETAVSDRTGRMIRRLHARCVTGSVRDPHSADVVLRAGAENIAVTGCPVLFWRRGNTLPPVRQGARRRIVVTARNWLMHHWPANVDHPAQLRLIRTLLASFPIDRLVFAIHEDYDARLVDLLDIPRRLVFRSADPEDYVHLYSDDDTVVFAMRLHAGMLAVANGVPALFVGHDTRTYSFCSMLDLPYVELFRDDCAATCVARLRAMLDGDVGSLTAAATRFAALRRTMDEFLDANALPCWQRPEAAAFASAS